MTPRDFYLLLREHDWYYQYSDDQRYWRAGQAESAAIRGAVEAQPELQPLLDAFTYAVNSGARLPTEQELLGN